MPNFTQTELSEAPVVDSCNDTAQAVLLSPFEPSPLTETACYGPCTAYGCCCPGFWAVGGYTCHTDGCYHHYDLHSI